MPPSALGLAATQCGGLNASLGTMAKPFHAGKAAMDGMLAAQLAAEGFEGATDLLDSESGLIPTLIQDGEVGMEGVEFSDGLALLDNGFKPYACCRSTHSAMDAAIKLAEQLNGGEVARVRVEVHPVAVRVAGKTDPQSPLEAKFSIAFVTALGLCGYQGSPQDFAPERIAEPRLRQIAGAVELSTNENFGRYATVMYVELTGGGTLRMEVLSPLGNPDNPMSWEQMEGKFQGLVAPLLGDDAAALFHVLRDIDSPGSLAEVARLVRGR